MASKDFSDEQAIPVLQAIAAGCRDSSTIVVDLDVKKLLLFLYNLAESYERDGKVVIESCVRIVEEFSSGRSDPSSVETIDTVVEMVQQLSRERAKKFIFNSLVGLAIEWQWVSDAKRNGVGVFSGFIAEFNGEWFWITAGHIVEDVFKQVDNGVLAIRQLRIVDGAGLNPLTKEGFTIELDLCSHAFFYSEEIGLDIGFVHMRQNYRELLAANGIRPVTDSMWASNADDEAAVGYALVGYPSELTVEQPESFTLKPEFIPVAKTNEPPESINKKIPRFYAHVPEVQSFASIKGMSGGPIIKFKFKEDGGLYFWVIGVQNSWDANARILAACPSEILKEAFVTWIRENTEY